MYSTVQLMIFSLITVETIGNSINCLMGWQQNMILTLLVLPYNQSWKWLLSKISLPIETWRQIQLDWANVLITLTSYRHNVYRILGTMIVRSAIYGMLWWQSIGLNVQLATSPPASSPSTHLWLLFTNSGHFILRRNTALWDRPQILFTRAMVVTPENNESSRRPNREKLCL